MTLWLYIIDPTKATGHYGVYPAPLARWLVRKANELWVTYAAAPDVFHRLSYATREDTFPTR